jgi:hypothetical protein
MSQGTKWTWPLNGLIESCSVGFSLRAAAKILLAGHERVGWLGEFQAEPMRAVRNEI